jgi:hypothetical protein
MTLRAGVVKLAGVALAGALLMVAAPAAAKPCHPHNGGGNAEVGQYLETLPGPCGDNPIGGNSGSGSSTGGNQGSGTGSGSSATGLPPATINELQTLGPAGRQAAGFAESTSPSVSGIAGAGDKGGSRSTPGSAKSSAASDGGGSLLSALGQVLAGNNASAGSSGEGLGPWLPILLGLVLIGGVGALALRRGRTG